MRQALPIWILQKLCQHCVVQIELEWSMIRRDLVKCCLPDAQSRVQVTLCNVEKNGHVRRNGLGICLREELGPVDQTLHDARRERSIGRLFDLIQSRGLIRHREHTIWTNGTAIVAKDLFG